MPAALRKAWRGETADLRGLIRADASLAADYAEQITDLLAFAKFPKRAAAATPAARSERDALKQAIITVVRYREQHDPQVVAARQQTNRRQ